MRSSISTLTATFITTLCLAALPVVGQSSSLHQGRQRASRLNRAEALVQAQNLAGAESELATLLKEHPQNAEALNLLGVVRARQSRADEAEALFKQSIAAAPRRAGTRINLGLLYVARSQLEEAAVEFEEALKLAPHNRAAAAQLVKVLRGLAAASISSDAEKALAHLVRAKALAPSDPEVLFEFGMAALRLTLHEDAAPALQAALARRPNEPKYIYALARARMGLGDLSAAERLFSKYTALRPEDATGYFGLGYVLAGQKRNAEARSAFERSLALHPEQTESNYQLGLLELAEGNLDEAAIRFAKVLARFGNHTGALVGWGQVQFNRKQYEAARQSLEQAVALEPTLQPAHYYLSLTYARLGDKEAARRAAEVSATLEREQKNQRRTILKLYEPEKDPRPMAERKP